MSAMGKLCGCIMLLCLYSVFHSLVSKCNCWRWKALKVSFFYLFLFPWDNEFNILLYSFLFVLQNDECSLCCCEENYSNGKRALFSKEIGSFWVKVFQLHAHSLVKKEGILYFVAKNIFSFFFAFPIHNLNDGCVDLHHVLQ